MPSKAPGSTRSHSGLLPRNWPKDLLILSFVTGSLWAITIVWVLSGSGQSMEPPLRSESDAWLFALSGAALLYLFVHGMVTSWGVILGIPTSLFVVSLSLRRARPTIRMLAAGLVTAAIFMGAPAVLNQREEQRLVDRYNEDDKPLPSSVGRAIEIASGTPRMGDFPIRCNSDCLDLMIFGRADSVTLTFPKGGDHFGGKPSIQNFRVGYDTPDCDGPSFKKRCAYATGEDLPDDRLILTFETVAPRPADATDVFVRRLYVRDTGRPAEASAMRTELVFARYPGLLNIAWGERGFFLRRDSRPIILAERLDAQLYRAFIANRKLDGKTYPFR